MEKKYKKTYIFLRNFALLIIITHCSPTPFYTRLYEEARNTSLNTVDNIPNEELIVTEQDQDTINEPVENEIELCIPNIEICNGEDDDCDETIDEDSACQANSYYCDNDSDGDKSSIISGSCTTYNCIPSECQANAGNDCDDNNANINIGSQEICDGIDNNCDTSIDENLTRPTTCGVGICEGNTGAESCSNGIWGNATCDPFEGAQTELCGDTLDSNCDGNIDDGCVVENKTDTFTQTSSYTITYTQEDTGQKSVDILWVVDNSISMEDNQQNLVDNFSNFITSISESVPGSYVDYHIGVITTTEFTTPLTTKEIDQYNDNCIEAGNCEGWSIEGHGRLQGINEAPKFITADNVLSDFSTDRCTAADIFSGTECAFYENGMVGTGGHFAESGFITTELALTHPENLSNYNLGFSRDGVPIVIIFLSDSDDMSHWIFETNAIGMIINETQRQCQSPYNYEFCVDGEFDPNQTRSIDYYSNFFTNIKGENNKNLVKLFSIVITQGSTCLDDFDSYPPSRNSSGINYTYAYRYITLMEQFYNLTSTDPNPYVKDICDPGGFPQIISEIGSYISQDLKAQFALCNEDINCNDVNIDPSTIHVTVNDSESNNWTYYADSKIIVFQENSIPQDGDIVTISYDEIRITTFTLSESNIKEIISIKINDAPIDNWLFNKALNQITIYDDSIKSADAIIEIKYDYYFE
jgi:hypothetical protein